MYEREMIYEKYQIKSREGLWKETKQERQNQVQAPSDMLVSPEESFLESWSRTGLSITLFAAWKRKWTTMAERQAHNGHSSAQQWTVFLHVYMIRFRFPILFSLSSPFSIRWPCQYIRKCWWHLNMPDKVTKPALTRSNQQTNKQTNKQKEARPIFRKLRAIHPSFIFHSNKIREIEYHWHTSI